MAHMLFHWGLYVGSLSLCLFLVILNYVVLYFICVLAGFLNYIMRGSIKMAMITGFLYHLLESICLMIIVLYLHLVEVKGNHLHLNISFTR